MLKKNREVCVFFTTVPKQQHPHELKCHVLGLIFVTAVSFSGQILPIEGPKTNHQAKDGRRDKRHRGAESCGVSALSEQTAKQRHGQSSIRRPCLRSRFSLLCAASGRLGQRQKEMRRKRCQGGRQRQRQKKTQHTERSAELSKASRLVTLMTVNEWQPWGASWPVSAPWNFHYSSPVWHGPRHQHWVPSDPPPPARYNVFLISMMKPAWVTAGTFPEDKAPFPHGRCCEFRLSDRGRFCSQLHRTKDQSRIRGLAPASRLAHTRDANSRDRTFRRGGGRNQPRTTADPFWGALCPSLQSPSCVQILAPGLEINYLEQLSSKVH